METGTVAYFKVNEYGGFGFIETKAGESIYFQRNGGGPVESGKNEPVIMTWARVREPRPGDLINFNRSTNRKGPIAAPWCYHEEWNQAFAEIAARPTYRVIRRRGRRVVGNQKPEVVWQGKFLPDLKKVFPDGIALTTQYSGDHWSVYWFEQQTDDGKWRRTDGDPRMTKYKEPDVRRKDENTEPQNGLVLALRTYD